MSQATSDSAVWEPSEFFKVLEGGIEMATPQDGAVLLESLPALMKQPKGRYIDFSAQFPHLAVLEVKKRLPSTQLYSFLREKRAVKFTKPVWNKVKEFLSQNHYPTNDWYISLGDDKQLLWRMCGSFFLPYVVEGPMDQGVNPGRRVLCVYNKTQEKGLLHPTLRAA